MDKEWSGKTQGGSFGQKFLLWYFRHGSIYAAYGMLALVVPFYMLFAHKGYNSIYTYFREIHGQGRIRSFISTYRNHFLFGQAMFDKIALFAGRNAEYNLELVGNDAFTKALDSEKSIIIVSSHCGNFELAGHLLTQDKKPVNALAFGGENPAYQEARQDSLEKHNIRFIPAKSDMSHILLVNSALQNGEILITPADRGYQGTRMAKFMFMGKEAQFPTGPFYFATKYGANLFSLFVMKEGPFHYKGYVTQHPVSCDPNLNTNQNSIETAKEYVRIFQEALLEYPLQWYNFFHFWK